MDFRQLQYLTAVAEYQSITKAADALFISQPAMSHYIKKAEEELGLPLFDRSTTPLSLTYAGKRYIETARKILLENDQLMKEFRDITHHMTGIIRVGTSRDRASYMMPELLRQFAGLYPNIKVEVMTQSGQLLRKALRDGAIDMVLLPYSKQENMQGFEMQTVYTEELLLSAKKGTVTGAQTVAGHPHAVCPKALDQMPFFLLFQGHVMRAFCDNFFKKHRITPRTQMEFASNITCYRMSATGMGLAIIPHLTVLLAQCDQPVELYSLGETPVTWDVEVFYRKGAYLGQPERDFIALSKSIFGSNGTLG